MRETRQAISAAARADCGRRRRSRKPGSRRPTTVKRVPPRKRGPRSRASNGTISATPWRAAGTISSTATASRWSPQSLRLRSIMFCARSPKRSKCSPESFAYSHRLRRLRGPRIRLERGDILAAIIQLSRGGTVAARYAIDDRGLAGSVRADDGKQLALSYTEADIGKRAHAAETQRHSAHFQYVIHQIPPCGALIYAR